MLFSILCFTLKFVYIHHHTILHLYINKGLTKNVCSIYKNIYIIILCIYKYFVYLCQNAYLYIKPGNLKNFCKHSILLVFQQLKWKCLYVNNLLLFTGLISLHYRYIGIEKKKKFYLKESCVICIKTRLHIFIRIMTESPICI